MSTPHEFNNRSIRKQIDYEEYHEYDTTSICDGYNAQSIANSPENYNDFISPPPDYDSISIISRQYDVLEKTESEDILEEYKFD